jgi:two-component system chemotaxis response regulator CheB
MADNPFKVIAIGGSVGAIGAIQQLCQSLSPEAAAAICLVIHVGPMGRDHLADIFGHRCPIPFATAAEGEALKSGRAYVAPADRHLLILNGVIRLGRGPRENLARPALDPLFRSAGLSFGSRAIGVVLTGMLSDGAAGLSDLKRCGGVTVVQNPTDSEAPDMPLAALRASDVDYRVSLSDMGDLLMRLVGEPAGAGASCPEDIQFEVEIALGRPFGTHEAFQLGDPVPLSCPACGGVLSQIRRSSNLRFRCQVGHGFTAEALESQQEGSIDQALRVALRILEERALLTQKMADEARGRGRLLSAQSFEQRTKESREHVETLREAIGKVGR